MLVVWKIFPEWGCVWLAKKATAKKNNTFHISCAIQYYFFHFIHLPVKIYQQSSLHFIAIYQKVITWQGIHPAPENSR